jgi:phage repressor protein C with HTH and peptisase S24 domain
VAINSLVIFWKSMPHYYIRIEDAQYLCNENTYYNRDMKTLQERIIWARGQKAQRDNAEFTQQDLANRAGVTQGSIAHLESGRTKTSRSLTKIAAALGVSSEWLADGKGAPFTTSIAEGIDLQQLPGTMRVFAADPDHPSRTKIPKVAELKLSAGITGFQVQLDERDGGEWDLPTRWLEKKGLNPRHLLAIEVTGESMEPNLYEGDLVVINTADTHLINGEVYAVNYEGEAVIKRLIREGGMWYLSSDNMQPKFARRVCQGRECIIIGKVVRRETDQI